MYQGGGHYKLRRNDLLYPELSYKINGILFDIFRQVGGGHNEKFYQKCVRLGFEKERVFFKEQFYVPLKCYDKIVGKYFLDFLVDDKIILELKRGRVITSRLIEQVEGYLKALGLELALIACFTYGGVFIKRIVNHDKIS
ncbi:GxxExxY protein [Patescibacteria group bacterium]|nr:GxxExxY protein [Patescibacteria group bacterium]